MKYVFMDLDGTLTNSMLGITKSVQYALKAFDITETDSEVLCKYIGPPLRNSFQIYHGLSEEESEAALRKYREYFVEKGILENEVYEGMEDLLIRLKEAGKILIVATSKPEIYARRILEHFGLEQYFTDICGATLDNSRGTKEEVIRYAIEKNRITDYSQVVMIGDRKHDIEGAKCVGVASIGVLYGFGSREELEAAGADKIADTVEDIYDVVTEW